ncbi:hypothetical protein [Clostridioides difficile]|uniref:hypothetical protein n=1 Tax=Clostridioides difficile TaxID=1496 RepID=UPI001F2BDB10|nr:hypothetical protein [Clostridioides difficile]MCB4319755.1 hypothetical protein [Clostridioides difficile]MCE4818193.1 hypothetical protein [Clostridioides difficile]MCK3701869.1 hypothetical protein [Clostridioides difficile]MCR1622463.1 hypothetical protein [Clostridioides difficile]MCR1633617.1 hypothetical protein [Clostridioides difficile]
MSTGKASIAGAPPPKDIISGSVMELKRLRTIFAEFFIFSILFANFTILVPPFYQVDICL